MAEKYAKQKSKGWKPNPTGKGGFQDRPQDINCGGFTKEQKAQHKVNRDRALAIEDRMLSAVEGMFNEHPEKEKIVQYIRADVLRLVHTAIERYDGKPKQSVDLSSEDGSMSPKAAERDAVLDALKAKHGAKSE
jgi:hypothetical protein